VPQEDHEDILASEDDERKNERASGDGQDQQSNKSEKVEMDWARAEITSRQPCMNSPNMDTGGKKERKTKGDMEENCEEREETSGIQVME
jgi:hypothetical protein